MINLYKPNYEDLWFKQLIMSDGETMSYNHDYGGTIPFPKEKWYSWFCKWIENEDGKRFYQYIKNDEDAFVGELSYNYDDDKNVYMANVVIYSKYRNRGYGSEALKMLCEIAKENGIAELYDEIAIDNPSVNIFLKQGFSEISRNSKIITVMKRL